MNKLRVLLPTAAVVAASVAGAVAWLVLSADSAIAVTPPKVDAKTAAACAALQHHLLHVGEGDEF